MYIYIYIQTPPRCEFVNTLIIHHDIGETLSLASNKRGVCVDQLLMSFCINTWLLYLLDDII